MISQDVQVLYGDQAQYGSTAQTQIIRSEQAKPAYSLYYLPLNYLIYLVDKLKKQGENWAHVEWAGVSECVGPLYVRQARS